MGVWGAAQAGAFAIGGFVGAVSVGALRGLFHQTVPAFLIVFGAEALVFLLSAHLASRIDMSSSRGADAADAVPSPIQFGGAAG
jgi:BCD family chlorophyll transporter-like MFS transporter